jgi:hypothetical protein
MSTSLSSVPGSISSLQITHFMEAVMADLMTESQGNEIINLLETISGYLFDIKVATESSAKNLKAANEELGNIEVNTRG